MGYPCGMNGPALERGPATILIADDLPDLLQALKETLEREGFVVTAVGDGQSAIEAIRADPPDIAVLDLKMPRLTGFQVCQALREDPLLENLPVIILSASGTRDSKVAGLDLGADDFITKPVDVRELLARIRMILKRSRQGIDANPLTRESIKRDPWPITLKPDNFVIIVAGGGHPTNSFWLQGYSPRVIGREIRVPESFDQLLIDADRDLGCGSDACMI